MPRSPSGARTPERGTLLERRLHFIVGKGGVGKTTVASALALAASRKGQRVLLVEIDVEDHVSPLFGREAAPAYEPVEIAPGLYRMNVEGRAALEEYLSLTIPIRRVLKAVFSNRVYQYFVAAAPGLKELMTVGKIWYEVHEKDWNVVVVDCPGTGHTLQYLRMPKTAHDTFTAGLVRRETERVWSLLRDPSKTAISVVTLAEEMPVNETIELCRQLRDELGLPEGCLVVNRFRQVEFGRADLDRAGRDLATSPDTPTGSLAAAVLDRATTELDWSALNERNRARLAEEVDWQTILLPFLFREEFTLHDVEELAERLHEGLAARASADPVRGAS